VDSIPKLKQGDPKHIQGFILYKLWLGRCWIGKGGHHKHIDLENDLPTNYDSKFKGEILKQARELHINRLVTILKSEGREIILAVFSESSICAGLPIVNAYLRAVGEDPLEGTIREILTGKRSEKRSPLSKEELRKFARMHRESQKR
jgi:hypothetical protein